MFYLYSARAARGFGDGFAALILPAYLSALGFGPVRIGIVAAAALLGSAVLTLAIGLIAPRYDLRTLLLACAGLMIATGIAFPASQHFVFIALAPGKPLRPREHDGVHPHPFEHLSHRGSVHFESARRARASPAAIRILTNGRADAHVLRHGRRYAPRTHGSGKHDSGSPQPCLLHQPGNLRCAPLHILPRPAARALRRAQDRVRPLAPDCVPPPQAAGGAAVARMSEARCGAARYGRT